MRTTIAGATFRGQEMVDGQVWWRICHDCGRPQPDKCHVNDLCIHCGCPCVTWLPKIRRKAMTIDEAIEELKELMLKRWLDPYAKERQAIQLGIEALKRLKEEHDPKILY